jgi:translation initiation factor 5
MYVIKGSHDESKLISLLYCFIRMFVLCQKCNSPETIIKSNTNQTIRQNCDTCGHIVTINKAIHKLTTYIINHPSNNLNDNKPSFKENRGRRSCKKKSKNNQSGIESPTNNNKVTQLANEDSDDFDPSELTAYEYNKRMREMCGGSISGVYRNDLKRESGNLFYKIAKEKKEANLLSDKNIQKELFEEAKRLDITAKSTLILSEILFTENILVEIKKYKILLLKFCLGNKKAQKYLLGGYEKLVGNIYKEELLNKAVYILKQFYDEEILDEDVIIEWSAKESKKYVSKEISKKIREKVAPLIKWLKEAEVEKSDEESSEIAKSITDKEQQHQREKDKIDINFSHRSTTGCIRVLSAKPIIIVPINIDVQSDSVKDIDIDNI